MTQQNINTMQDILDALEQNPQLQQEFHKHLVDVVRHDDALRQDLRKEILTEELLQLPVRFAQFEQAVGERFDRLESDVAVLKSDVAELKDDMMGVKQQLTTMSGQIANLTGNDYETRAIEGPRRIIRRALGMEQAIILHASERESPTEFETEFLVPAIRAGRITRQQADELEEADSIIRCENPDGEVVCAVAEISVTVQDHDRSRAAERARIFSLATGLRTVAYTVGQDQEEPEPGIPDVPFLKY